MKRMCAVALFVVSCVFAAKGVPAQERVLRANIPFDFNVGNTWMPAGEYLVSSPDRQEILVKNVANGSMAEVVSLTSFQTSDSRSKLVFDRYGGAYFLHRSLCPGNQAMNVDIPQSKAEKKIRTLEARAPNKGETLVAA